MRRVSWLRIGLMVLGIFAIVPLTLVFGVLGFVGALFFLLLAVLAT